MKILKRIHIVISIMLMLVLAGSNLSFAQVKMENNSEIDFIREIKNESFSADKEHLRYIENAVSSKEMNDIILKYQKKYSNSQAYTMFKKNLKNIYEEGQANNFSETQIKALFIAATNLETSDTFDDKTNYSAEIPDFAPSHAEEFNFENVNRPYSNFKEGLLNNSDKSQRTSYETAGIGYEVRSTPGYNQTTTFLNPGRCNVTAPEGKAGYMFYTIYCNDHYQDIGIGYFAGKWHVIVSGYWTNWGTANVAIFPGDRLYLKIWIGDDSRINLQLLDGNNFNNILYQNSYTTYGEIPSSGKGVRFNRQITLVDTAHNPLSGLYLEDASFDQSYLYNNYTYSKFKNSNTQYNRRGKFGCSWKPDSAVSILDNSHWSFERISMNMN